MNLEKIQKHIFEQQMTEIIRIYQSYYFLPKIRSISDMKLDLL